MADLLIRNARLVDGSGADARDADVRVAGGFVAEIGPAGSLSPSLGEVIEAEGQLLTPGFVDLHTHYDGQATWDPVLAPSAWHGVTTAVMGNCGVGFAPAKAGERGWLIELMEGVEDIPGTALHEGIRWAWETFPEYLDALEQLPRTLDVATQVPHGALRLYVMGARGANQEPATPDDLAEMARHVEAGVRAGALSFSSNRLPGHTSIHGEPVPGTFAAAEELEALTAAAVRGGSAILQVVPAGAANDEEGAVPREVDLYREISLATGAKVVFSCVPNHPYPDEWREVLRRTHAANAAGARLVPQVLSRSNGLMLSLETFNPFVFAPAYQELAQLPPVARAAELMKPERRARVLEQAAKDNPSMFILAPAFDSTFAMEDGPVFEPNADDSIGRNAAAAGVDPLHLLYDEMCALAARSTDGRTRMLAVFFAGYPGGNLDAVGEMLRDEYSVIGLGDGGAHCSMICDASWPSFVLQHWVRDRTRGPRVPLERAVKWLTKDPADVYGLGDRGVVAVGKRADLNLIDLDALSLGLPELTPDLPTGASRILQRAQGYTATLCAGEVTFRDGEPTGARPGRLVRGPR